MSDLPSYIAVPSFPVNQGEIALINKKQQIMKRTEKPKVVVIGLSLELYHHTWPDYIERQEKQLKKFISGIEESVEILSHDVCYLTEQVESKILMAGNSRTDALLIVPMCYTASYMSVPVLLETNIPLIIFNTQELYEVKDGFDDNDDLSMNHVIQGTQDVTNMLVRGNKVFGLVSGHYQDEDAINDLKEWLDAAKTSKRTKKSRVGLLGTPFQDMGDFGVDETMMGTKWGPHIIYLGLGRFHEVLENIGEKSIDIIVERDRDFFEVDEKLSEATHRNSVKLELALRKLIEEKELDAFTMNFQDIVNDGRFNAIPFLGINKMLSEGLGYAGEGDVTRAALMSQMQLLCGSANFTETYTVDFKRNLILMDHMQECNPAFARKDRKIRLIHMDFWAKGVGPYSGMYFTLEPGPITLVTITTKSDGSFYYVCYETRIFDAAPLKNFFRPHWFIQPDESVGSFLTRYSMTGAPHHIVAVPGHCAGKIRKLAVLQNFECIVL